SSHVYGMGPERVSAVIPVRRFNVLEYFEEVFLDEQESADVVFGILGEQRMLDVHTLRKVAISAVCELAACPSIWPWHRHRNNSVVCEGTCCVPATPRSLSRTAT